MNLSFNLIEDLQFTTGELHKLDSLKILVLQGNPLALTPQYRKYTLENLKSLKSFDLTPIQKGNWQKRVQNSEEIKTEYVSESSFDLSVTVGGGIKGTSVEEELWTAAGQETPFDELDDKYKSSRFHISANFLGEEVLKSEDKLWDLHFDVEEEVGRTDFSLNL